MTIRRWERRGSSIPFETPWFRVRRDEIRLPDGSETTFHVIERPGFVTVLPLRDDGSVVLERVYRTSLDLVQLECPAGGVDDETPEAAALRELEEETGWVAGRLEHLGRFASTPGVSDERFDVYLATELRPDGRIAREITEEMEIVYVPFDELHARVLRGEVTDGPTALAVLLAWNRITGRR